MLITQLLPTRITVASLHNKLPMKMVRKFPKNQQFTVLKQRTSNPWTLFSTTIKNTLANWMLLKNHGEQVQTKFLKENQCTSFKRWWENQCQLSEEKHMKHTWECTEKWRHQPMTWKITQQTSHGETLQESITFHQQDTKFVFFCWES